MRAENPLPVLIQMRGFKDRGGLPRFGADANQHRQFARALERYLRAEAKGRYFVGSAPREVRTQSLVLEGELSRTEQGEGGVYLCVLRLKDDRTERWVGQWAGVAENFRFLYGNLSNADGVSAQGLVGELGGAVVVSLVRQNSMGTDGMPPARILTASH